jgi:hypothetical protein
MQRMTKGRLGIAKRIHRKMANSRQRRSSLTLREATSSISFGMRRKTAGEGFVPSFDLLGAGTLLGQVPPRNFPVTPHFDNSAPRILVIPSAWSGIHWPGTKM